MRPTNLYVACSRATTAEGLLIIESFTPPNKFFESDPIFMELNTTKALTTTFNFKFKLKFSPRKKL